MSGNERDGLLASVSRYARRYPEESGQADRVSLFIQENKDCFLRSHVAGHVCGSAWVLSSDHRSVLLMHHRKLGRWLQPGGHCDGDPDPARTALRETGEETGITQLRLCSPEIFDIDIHQIPARAEVDAHLHYDLRYLFVAQGEAQPIGNSESREVRWIALDKVKTLTQEPSIMRMCRKTPPRDTR